MAALQFARNWPLARAKFASAWLCHPQYQRIFQTKYQRAASRMQILHALTASCVQSRQFFAIKK
jgi:hypothetical protein